MEGRGHGGKHGTQERARSCRSDWRPSVAPLRVLPWWHPWWLLCRLCMCPVCTEQPLVAALYAPLAAHAAAASSAPHAPYALQAT